MESFQHVKGYNTLWLLLGALFLKLLFVIGIILYGGIGLGPDEAQYWTWSKQLDFGYYSKPPGIAWQIWLGTFFFGDTELGVRFGSLVIGFLLPIVVFYVGVFARLTPKACFWGAMIMALNPLGMMSSFLAITDGGVVLFWALASLVVVYSLHQKTPHYYMLGATIACGALFKWVMYEFWLAAFVLVWFAPYMRSKHMLGGMLLSLLGLLPSFVWNTNHDWATFRHVAATMWNVQTQDVGATALAKGNFFEFLGAQALLFSPIWFVLLLVAFWQLKKTYKQASIGVLFCGIFSLCFLGGNLAVSFFKKMQGNWADFIYPVSAVFLAWYAYDVSSKLRRWLYAGAVLAVFLSFFMYSLPTTLDHRLSPLPYKMNPFKHNLGWDRISQVLKNKGYVPDTDFLASDKYQTTSILSFYSPEKKRAYFFNVGGIRKNQFSYWPGLHEEQMDKSGYFVVIENMPLHDPRWELLQHEYLQKLQPYFSEVKVVGVDALYFAKGGAVKGILLFKVAGYNGLQPQETSLY